MSSHSNANYYGHQGHIYYENSSRPPVSRQSGSPEQSWTSSTLIGNQIGYSQPYQSVDPVRNQLEVHDAEVYPFHDYHDATVYSPLVHFQDMPFTTNQPQSNLPLQVPGVQTDATYSNVDTPLQSSISSPYGYYPPFEYGQFQHQSCYAPYDPFFDPQSYIYSTQMSNNFAQSFPPQTSQAPSTSEYPYPSSTQLLSPDHGGPVYQTNTGAPPIPANFSQNGANTATLELPDPNARQHSHSLPVETSSSNQSSLPGPSRPQPSSPERRRLLPRAADEEHPTARRVAHRSDRAWSVHSTDSYIPGRGEVIPQPWYTSNTVTSYNTPAPRACIPFKLENPDQNGIPITDILNQTSTGSFARLRNRADTFDMGKLTFTLRILWPGYKPWTKTISAKNWKKDRGPVNRAKLAEVVAKAVRDLIKKKGDEKCHAEYAEWHVGRGGIRLEQICLVALWQVSRGSWQPQLCLIESRR